MFVKSLHFKVTAWYTLAFIAIIFVFGTLVYQDFKHSLFGNLDNLLKTKAESIEDLIDSRYEEDVSENKISALMGSQVSDPEFLQAIRSTIQEEQGDGSFVQILDVQGKRLASSNKDKGQIDAASFRVFTLPVLKRGKVSYIIQVGGSVAPVYSTLHKLKRTLYLFLPLSLFAAVFIGFFLTKMALEPVNKISDTMRQINTKNLQERINMPNAANEIRTLADTFNDMLTRLDRAFSTQKQFIQDISHELKTPLTAMRGKQEVTLAKLRTVKEYESVLQVNLDEIEKMIRLVENLLVLISIEQRQVFSGMETFDLALVIKRAMNDMMALVQQKQIRINSSLHEDVLIKGYASQISRVVLNLLDNAIKYTPKDGYIDIKLYQEGALAKIVFTNTGLGIDKEDLPRIFDRFYRADKSRNTPGFGLGLSIAKSIVDLHKGTIEAASQVGQSSIFTVSIPSSPSQKD